MGRILSALYAAFFVLGVLVALVVVGTFFSLQPRAAETVSWPGPYTVDLVKVSDGDTVVVRFGEGPCERGPCAGSIWSIRIAHIDTPEKKLCRGWETLVDRLPTMTPAQRTKQQSCAWCPAEKQAAVEARAYVAKLLAGRALRASDLRRDPYWGRLVGVLEVDAAGEWRALGDILIEVGLAVPYDPGDGHGFGKAKPWCEGN